MMFASRALKTAWLGVLRNRVGHGQACLTPNATHSPPIGVDMAYYGDKQKVQLTTGDNAKKYSEKWKPGQNPTYPGVYKCQNLRL
jgi:hypothetical protein